MMLSILLQAEAPAAGGSPYSGLIMIVALFAIMYFFMIRPQQKQKKELEKQRAALGVGDKIVTAGGIHGKIKEVKDTTFVIEIADNVRVKMDKTSIFAAPNEQASK
ncbi:preprotein translocase subunit YajC [Dysgonomonadaceae bacterium PH5-43]|nr:preprotein translocase subunit YajC [Dysgonomonadaceae bacterium PH5-43]